MAKQKSPFLSSFGVAFQVLKAVTDAVLAEGGSDDDLRSLLSDPEKCRRVALEIVGRKVQTGSPYRGDMPSGNAPPADRYRIHVTYAPLQGVKALEPELSGEGSVSEHFDGRTWERHSSCAKIDETPGEREFWLAEVPERFRRQRIVHCRDSLAAHFNALDYRFTIETEAVEFATAQPELRRKNQILALGSSARGEGGHRFVAMMYAGDRGRVLRGEWVDSKLDADGRLLLVREASSSAL